MNKEINWKKLILGYIIFLIVLSLLSSAMKRFYNFNIHANFIFITVLLIHIGLLCNAGIESKWKYLLEGYIGFSVIRIVIAEFYAVIPWMQIVHRAWFAVLILVFLISILRNKFLKKNES